MRAPASQPEVVTFRLCRFPKLSLPGAGSRAEEVPPPAPAPPAPSSSSRVLLAPLTIFLFLFLAPESKWRRSKQTPGRGPCLPFSFPSASPLGASVH